MTLVLALVLALALSGQASSVDPACRAVYEDRNQIDYTIRISNVRGEVVEPSSSPMRGACVQLFTDSRDPQFLKSVVSDRDGRFDFSGLEKGKTYRFVVRAEGLCPANARVRIVSRPTKKRIVVSMRAAGIDSCSYAELK